MNLILFEPEEIGRPLLRSDPRAEHLLAVLRREPGGVFAAGLSDGTPGTGVVRGSRNGWIEFEFRPGTPLPVRPTTQLLIGLPRPQTARDILRDATTLGATALHFVATARADPNYAASSLWEGEWRRHIRAGAMQACDPRLPEVTWTLSLEDALPGSRAHRLYAFDNYEATGPFASERIEPNASITLAIGPERGWDEADRVLLRRAGARLLHLGSPVLRTETAVLAALTLATAARLRG